MWLIKADQNTKFFHAAASERRRDRIKKLIDEDGREVEGGRLKKFIANQYKNIFLSHAGSQADDVLCCVSSHVTSEINAALIKQFTEEVWEALQSIRDLKAPGPDDAPTIFYKKVLAFDW